MSAQEKQLATLFVALALLGLGVLLLKTVSAVAGAVARPGGSPDGATVVRSLGVGDCIRGIPATSSTPVDMVDCDATHDARLVGRVTLSDTAASAGGPAAVEASRRACATAFAARYSAAPEAYWAAVPSTTDYAAGDRLVVCFSPT